MRLSPIVMSLALFGLTVLVVACSKNEPAANTSPVIAYKSIRKITLGNSTTLSLRDSIITNIDFSDNDGDLGESLQDTARIRQLFGNQSWGNYEILTFALVGSKFEEITTAANSKHFVDLGKAPNMPVKGTLDYSQAFSYKGSYKIVPVKFQIRIRDRALNVSNVVETDTVHVPIGQ